MKKSGITIVCIFASIICGFFGIAFFIEYASKHHSSIFICGLLFLILCFLLNIQYQVIEIKNKIGAK